VADEYDALVTARVYKPPFSHQEAVRIIREGRGSHFDPDVVDALFQIEDVFWHIALEFVDTAEDKESLERDEHKWEKP
jgi:putative two-component system response regulator